MIVAMPDLPAAAYRTEFSVFRVVPTRWMDNDVFGHANNATYYSFFDTAVCGWLAERGCVGVADGPMWMVAETGCRYLSKVAFPDVLAIGLSLARLGRSSAQYHLGVFRDGAELASAVGHFAHVHIDRATRRPSPIPEVVRVQLATLQSQTRT